jgi:hypothetical protein
MPSNIAQLCSLLTTGKDNDKKPKFGNSLGLVSSLFCPQIPDVDNSVAVSDETKETVGEEEAGRTKRISQDERMGGG